MKSMRKSMLAVILTFVLLLTSCNLPFLNADQPANGNTEATLNALSTQIAAFDSTKSVPTVEILAEESKPAFSHVNIPGSMGPIEQLIDDTDSSITATKKRAPSGEIYIANIFERPFEAADMIYRPDLDIQEAFLSRDSIYFYFQIKLKGVDQSSNSLLGTYGIEFETTFDMRGDFYISAEKPTTTEWNQDGVTIFKDSNYDVGGSRPIYADANPGDGFDQQIFPTGPAVDPDAAWTRVSPTSVNTVELAIKRSVIGDPSAFIWNVWADDGLKAPEKRDYNDAFTLAEAGSSLIEVAQYPLKAIEKLDSTCRMNNGFTPQYEDDGLCRKPTPPTATPEPGKPAGPGTISGKVFWDYNENKIQDPSEPGAVTFIKLGEGSCPSEGISVKSSTSGNFGFLNQPAGTYCITVDTAYSVSTPRSYTVQLEPGGTVNVLFGLVPIG